MKKMVLLIVGLVLCSVPALAGEYLMNDTGETVYAEVPDDFGAEIGS